jgi:hypothetical protein
MAKEKVQVVEFRPIEPKTVTVTIVGDSDLILNKMNDVTTRQLTDARKDKAKDLSKPNEWEEVITAMHWLNGKPETFSEETLKENLDPEINAPCITAFGLKKSFGEAVTRNKISTYSTEFRATVNVIGDKDNLIPITFTEYHLDEKLMSPKKGAPVLVKLNRFSGWSATFKVSYLENVYSLDQIMNIINLSGFGLGIGSGRSSDYGRYHIENIK